MFNIPFKNPLEAETVSQRRERKARESEGSVRSSKSNPRPKLVDRAIAAKKVTILRFGKASKILPATLDCAQRGTANDNVDTGPAELPGSPLILESPSDSSDSPACVRPFSGLSFAPSVSRQEGQSPHLPNLLDADSNLAADSSTLGTANPSGHTTRQTLSQGWEGKLYTCANENHCSEHTSSIDATRIASPIQSSRSFIAQISRHRTERYPTVRYPSTSSTDTTTRSDTSCSPGSTPGTVHSHERPMSSFPAEHHNRGYIHASLAAALNTHIGKPGVDVELPSNTVPAAVLQDEQVQPIDLHSPITFPPLIESLPSTLLLVQNAPSKAICQRLNEDWEGTNSDVWKMVNSQKKVWALLGLRRLQHHLGEKSILSNGSDASSRERAEVVKTSNEGGRSLLCISEDGVEGWLRAATSPQQCVSCLRPSHSESSTLGIPTKFWTDMPILPYPDSSTDLISAGNTPGLLRSSQWPTFVQECARVLRPGGIFEVTIIDPMPRNCGPLLRQWIVEKVILGLERKFLITHPAMVIPLWLDDIAEFGNCKSHKFSFPAVLEVNNMRGPTRGAEGCSPVSFDQRGCEVQRLRTAVGRYFYQALYGNLIQAPVQEQLSSRWWWADPAVVRECQDYGPVFEMITYQCPKLMSDCASRQVIAHS